VIGLGEFERIHYGGEFTGEYSYEKNNDLCRRFDGLRFRVSLARAAREGF
jgi:hypothetical protein